MDTLTRRIAVSFAVALALTSVARAQSPSPAAPTTAPKLRAAAAPKAAEPIKIAPYGIAYFNLVLELRRGEQRRRAALRGGERAGAPRHDRTPEPPRSPGHRRHARQGQGHRRPRRRLLRRLSDRRHRRQHGRVPPAPGQRPPRLDQGQPGRRAGLDDLRAGQPALDLVGRHPALRRRRQPVVAPAAGARRVEDEDGAAAGRPAGAADRRLQRGVLLPAGQRGAVGDAVPAGPRRGRRSPTSPPRRRSRRSACRATGVSRG